MVNYVYDDIITAKDIFTGRVKKEDILGVSGWFLDIIPEDMSVNVLGRIGHFGILKDIRLGCAGAFREYATGPTWIYFMPEKKKSAPEFKVGDKVRIVKEWEGWGSYSKPTVGKTGIIRTIGSTSYGVYIPSDGYWWMYSPDALELVEEAEEKKSYEERQEEWIEANGIEIGDKVRVLRKAESHEDGWDNVWADSMSQSIGETLVVDSINGDRGIALDGLALEWECSFPYFVLEKVEDQPEYVPFDLDNPEVRRELMGKTIINNYGLDGDGEFRELMIVGFMNKSDEDRDCWSSNGDTEGTIAMTVEGYFHADELLKECTFSDGTPCGKIKED